MRARKSGLQLTLPVASTKLLKGAFNQCRSSNHRLTTDRLVLIYKGKTYRLNSPAAIAEWVTERRKNFPTNEQFTETRQRLQLAKAKEKLERARTTIKKGKVHLPSAPKILLKAAETPTQNGSEQAAISKQKIEKLRRKLEEEERKLALAEGERRSDEHENLPETKPNTGHIELPCANGTSSKQGPTPVAHSLKQEHDVDEGHAKPISDQSQSIRPGMKRVDSTSSLDSCNIDASSAISSGGSEDLTSSSGSSASDEDSGSDSAPEEQTSRIEAPTRVPPPARKGPKHICFQFQKSGTCAKGNSCPYQHTKDVNRTKKEKAQGRQAVPYKGRISLFQRVCLSRYFVDSWKLIACPSSLSSRNRELKLRSQRPIWSRPGDRQWHDSFHRTGFVVVLALIPLADSQCTFSHRLSTSNNS